MASYTISYTSNSVTFKVTGLTYGYTVRFYVRYNPDPGYALVDDRRSATSSTMTVSYNITAGKSYAVNVGTGTGGENDWIGAQFFTTPAGVVRPDNWNWYNYSYIASGRDVSISANAWNTFCARINAFRRYKGLSNYSFETVYSGGLMYAYQVNQAIIAINDMSGHGSTPSYVWPGDTMSASFMFQLQNALNAIP